MEGLQVLDFEKITVQYSCWIKALHVYDKPAVSFW